MTGPDAGDTAARLPLGRVAIVWAGLCALTLAIGAKAILAGRFPDPDDVLRMVQLRDWLGGQSWFDVTQYRIDPPAGVPMHWSRLVDVPLALVTLALQPLLGAATAQMAAAVIVPLVTLGCLVAVVGWIASRHFDREVVGIACLSCALVPATIAKFQPLRIDHHGWQVVTVALAAATLFAARPKRGAAVAGLALATGLSISLEVLPFAAAFAGVLALRWLVDAQRRELAPFMVALAGGGVANFAATRGLADLRPWCDAIAPAHLAFFAVVALGCVLTARAAPSRRVALVAALAGAGFMGLVAYAAIAPQCLSTPFGQLDPVVRHYWYENVAEGLPAWRQRPGELAGTLAPLVAAAVALVMLWRQSAGEAREQWGGYALLFAAACATGLLVWRSTAFAGALAAVPLGWLIVRALAWLRARSSPGAGLAAAAAALALAGTAPVLAPAARAQRTSGEAPPAVRLSSCDLRESAPALNRFAPATLFAPLDIGPSLIERSHHSTVATGHHRARAAMRDVITAFMADEAEARAIVARHGATLLVVCTDLAEPHNYAADAPHGLMARILRGEAPDWLEPVDIGAPPTLKVWRVRG